MLIKLSKEIYEYRCIKKAIEDYAEIAEITIENSATYFICKFGNCKYGTEITKNEFLNYIIDLMNHMGVIYQ